MNIFMNFFVLPLAIIMTGVNFYVGNYKTAVFCALLNSFSLYSVVLKYFK